MKKYWMFAKITIAEYMAYRMNFFMWRVRMVMQILIVYFLWTAVFVNQKIIFGYTESMMLSYILLTSLLRTYVFASTTSNIGEIINDGRLTNFLVRPIHFFNVCMARDAGDKFLNFSCSIIELLFLFLLFRPEIMIQYNFFLLFWVFVASCIAMVIYFYFSIIIGFIGFWTQEVWGPRFLSIILIEFFSGVLFPLNIFPEAFQKVAQYLPFQYFIYFPISIYLGNVDSAGIAKGIIIALIWMVLLFFIAIFIWRQGLKVYEAQGR